MTTAVLEAPAKPAQPKRLQGSHVHLMETARRSWHVNVPADHTGDDCMNPAYLWLRHDLLRVGDHIEMIHADFAFYIEAIVIKIDHDTQSVYTRAIVARDFSDDPMPMADLDAATIEQNDADGWRVVLGAAVLSKGHARKADAEKWLLKRKAGG